jgi:hypothetical protein
MLGIDIPAASPNRQASARQGEAQMAADEPRLKAARSLSAMIAEDGGKEALARGLAEMVHKLTVDNNITAEKVAAWQRMFQPGAGQRWLDRETGASAKVPETGSSTESASPETAANPVATPTPNPAAPPSRLGRGAHYTPAIRTAAEEYLAGPHRRPITRAQLKAWGARQGYPDKAVIRPLLADFKEAERVALWEAGHRQRKPGESQAPQN